jgi:hypothetical protein
LEKPLAWLAESWILTSIWKWIFTLHDMIQYGSRICDFRDLLQGAGWDDDRVELDLETISEVSNENLTKLTESQENLRNAGWTSAKLHIPNQMAGNKWLETNGRIGWRLVYLPGWRYTRLSSKTLPFSLRNSYFWWWWATKLAIECRYADMQIHDESMEWWEWWSRLRSDDTPVPSLDRNRKRHNQRESMRINDTYEKKQDQHDMIVVNRAPTLKRRG